MNVIVYPKERIKLLTPFWKKINISLLIISLIISGLIGNRADLAVTWLLEPLDDYYSTPVILRHTIYIIISTLQCCLGYSILLFTFLYTKDIIGIIGEKITGKYLSYFSDIPGIVTASILTFYLLRIGFWVSAYVVFIVGKKIILLF